MDDEEKKESPRGFKEEVDHIALDEEEDPPNETPNKKNIFFFVKGRKGKGCNKENDGFILFVWEERKWWRRHACVDPIIWRFKNQWLAMHVANSLLRGHCT